MKLDKFAYYEIKGTGCHFFERVRQRRIEKFKEGAIDIERESSDRERVGVSVWVIVGEGVCEGNEE